MRSLMLGVCAAALIFNAPHIVAFANTNSAGKLFVCADPQQDDLQQDDYEALDWVEVTGLGSHGETGSSTNILTYDTWDTDVIQKAKGITDAGSPEIELARKPNDAGQNILRIAANTNLNYAFKLVKNDIAVEGGIGTIIYNRGLVVGPRRPHGRNEDFDLEIFTLGLNQREVVVAPTSGGVAPYNTVVPAITGTAEVGEILNLSNGTFLGDPTITYKYQWFAGGVAIAGANANTFTLTTAQLGKIVTGRVTGNNGAGSASAMSAPTTAVAA